MLLNKKWAKAPNRYFSRDDILNAIKQKKRTFTSQVTAETQIKVTLRYQYHFGLTRMDMVFQKHRKWVLTKDAEVLELSHSWWEQKLM